MHFHVLVSELLAIGEFSGKMCVFIGLILAIGRFGEFSNGLSIAGITIVVITLVFSIVSVFLLSGGRDGEHNAG